MPVYPMQCRIPKFEIGQSQHQPHCGHQWDWHTRVGYYDRSRSIAFDNVYCPRCGRRGAERIYPADSAPTVPKVQGTWGRSAPPALRGKMYLNKAERDEQLASLGDPSQTIVPTEGRSGKGGDHSPSTAPKGDRAWETTMTDDPVHPPKPERRVSAEIALVDLLRLRGELRTGEIVDALDFAPSTITKTLRASEKIAKVKRGVWGLS